MTKSQDYFGLSRIVSLILAIFLPTSFVLGIATRFSEGKFVAGLIRLLFGWNLIWLADLVSMIITGKIIRILNV